MMMASSIKDVTDEALVQRALEDVEFFEILVDRYEERLRRYVYRISQFAHEEVEEILQDVFLSVWKNLRGFSPDMQFSSWIYRITHNETVSLFRKWKSRGQDEALELDEELFVPETTHFLEELDAKLSAKQVQKILAAMPEKYREILVLKFLEDQDYKAVSDILRIPEGTVATRINRAKKIFRTTAENLNISFS